MVNTIASIYRYLYNKPYSTVDFTFDAFCHTCRFMQEFVTRGKKFHCYQCGNEYQIFSFDPEEIKDLRIQSYKFWQHYPKLPYNWHVFSTDEKYLWKLNKYPK